MTGIDAEVPVAAGSGRSGYVHWGVRAAALGLVIALGVSMFLVGRAQSDDETAARGAGFCTPGTPGCNFQETIHEHADFALVINGTRFDFGQEKYISRDGDELDPRVHIHDPRHTVVHVHQEHVTWDAFFRTLGFELADPSMVGVERASLKLDDGTVLTDGQGGTFKFYINGVRVIGVGDLDIRWLQRVLISFGPENEDEVKAQLSLVTDEACIPGGLCPDRGSGAGEHGEPCSGVGTCSGAR
jgi:hypothetical protein